MGEKKSSGKIKQKKMRVGRYLLICFGFVLSSEHSIKQGRKKRIKRIKEKKEKRIKEKRNVIIIIIMPNSKPKTCRKNSCQNLRIV
jgi:hypothetical protein